jgi:hypothetical protein
MLARENPKLLKIMNLNDRRNGHSADVRIRLILNDRSIPVAQLRPDFLILHEPIEHPPADAEMILIVDGREESWHVRLPEGLRTVEPITRITCW